MLNTIIPFIQLNYIDILIGLSIIAFCFMTISLINKKSECKMKNKKFLEEYFYIILLFLFIGMYGLYLLVQRDKDYTKTPSFIFILVVMIGLAVTIVIIKKKYILKYFDKSFTYCNFINMRTPFFLLILGILSLIVFAWKLNVNPDFNNDEHYIVKTAYGFLQTGRFEQWDFVNNIAIEPYTRGWPYTLLVSASFKIFGMNVVSGRLVSVIIGVMFICSCFYIFQKMFKNKMVSFIACILIITNYRMIDLFRTIRMYPLSMLLMIWMLYFVIQAIDNKNHFKVKNKITAFIEKYFDYNLWYCLIALILIFLNYLVVANSLFILVGVIFYIVYKFYETKELRYKIASIILVSIFAGMIILYILPNLILFGPFKEINRILNYHIEYGNIQSNYLWELIIDPFGIYIGGILCLLGITSPLFLKREYHFNLVHVIGNVIFSIIFFTFFTTHIYRFRYIAHIMPFICILMAFGIDILIKSIKNLKFRKTFIISLLFMTILSFLVRGCKNYSIDMARPLLANAYGTIRDESGIDIENEFGYFSYHFHSEYLIDYKNIVYARMYAAYELREQNGKYGDDEFSEFIKLIKNQKQGVISIEVDKYHLMTKQFTYFLEKWTNKFAGPGIDQNNVYLYSYEFLDKNDYDQNITAWETEEGIFKFYENLVYVDLTGIDENIQMMSLKTEVQGETRFLQIGIENSDMEKGYLVFEKPKDTELIYEVVGVYNQESNDFYEINKEGR